MGRLASQDSPPLPGTWAPGERFLFIIVLLGGALFLYLLAKPLLHGSVYAVGDLGFFHLPLRQFYADCLAKGDNFHWIPWLFCGYYVHGEGQVGMYHPLHLLLYSLFPLNWAFNFEFLLNFIFLPCGVYLWLRGWLPRRDGALLGAILFTFSGFMLGHNNHINAVAIIGHLPWLLLAIDRLIEESNPRRRAAAGLGLGLLTMSQWLLGYPQYALMNTLVEGVYLLWRMPGLKRLAEAVLANALGLLAACVQFLPTWETLQLSQRSASDVHFAGTYSLAPLNLVQLFFPHSLRVDRDDVSPVNGLFLTAGLVSLWLLRRWGRGGKLAWFALPLAGLGILLAVGRFSPLFPLYAELPGVSIFRCPSRFVWFVNFAASVGAAILWCRLAQMPRESDPPPWKNLAWFLLLPVLAWPALSALRPVLVSVRQSTVWTEGVPMLCQVDQGGIARGILWTGALIVLVVLALRAWQLALAGLLVFVAADQYTLVGWATKMPAASLAQVYASTVPPVMENTCRLHSPMEVNANQLSLHRVGLTNGYVGLPPRRCLDYSDPATCQVAGVGWKWQDGLWKKVEGLPRARLVSRALVHVVPSQAIDQIDVATTALVYYPLDLDGGPPGSATLVSDRPGRISIEVEAPSRQLLVLAESFHPGWHLKVDGERRRPVAVYGDFLGCEVGAGQHQVEFFFLPRSLRLGAVLSAVGVTLLLVWFVWTGWLSGRWLSGRKVAWMPNTSTS